MRSVPGSYRLTFLLPADFKVGYVGPQPASYGSLLRVQGNLVEVVGPARQAVFDDATAMLRAVHDMTQLPLAITAMLESPPPAPGRDSWSIIIGADVAFSPTSIDPYFPRAAAG